MAELPARHLPGPLKHLSAEARPALGAAPQKKAARQGEHELNEGMRTGGAQQRAEQGEEQEQP